MDYFTSFFRSRPPPAPSHPEGLNGSTPIASGGPQSKLDRVEREPIRDRNAIVPSHPQTQSQSTTSPRTNKAPVIFTAGLAFSALSLLITRRSFARRRLRHLAHAQASSAVNKAGMLPGTGIEITQPVTPPKVNPSMEALEALNIATINVISFSMLAMGSALWYLDIGSLEDARRKLRGGLGVDGSERSEQEAEEEMEEWLAEVLRRKDEKARKKAKEAR